MVFDRRTFLKSGGALLAASVLQVPRAAASLAMPSSPSKSLSDIAEGAIRSLASPGVQISEWRAGHSAALISQGLANLETSTVVSSNSIFRIGSLTKQFTAAIVAKLQDEGKLSVHDRIDKYLTFFPHQHAPTLLELIHHTAGIHDGQEDCVHLKTMSQIDIAKGIATQAKLYDFMPGSAWLYSNANYILLGAVIESVTKKQLSEVAIQLIFEPLKLKDTRFDSCAEIVKGRVSGYSLSQSSASPYINAAYVPIEQAGGAGAMRSTSRDLCLWHYSLFSGKFVSDATLKAMVAPAYLKDGRPITQGGFDPQDNAMGQTSYGYGLLLDRATKGGGLIAMHNGFINGFSASLATYLPNLHTVAYLSNADVNRHTPFSELRRTIFAGVL